MLNKRPLVESSRLPLDDRKWGAKPPPRTMTCFMSATGCKSEQGLARRTMAPRNAAEQFLAAHRGRQSECRAQAVGTVPPSITNSDPVMLPARSEERNAIRLAISAGVEGRPIGMPPKDSMIIRLP